MSPERTDAGFPLCLEASNELAVSLPTCVCLWQEQNASNTKTLPGEGASKGPVAAMPSPLPGWEGEPGLLQGVCHLT